MSYQVSYVIPPLSPLGHSLASFYVVPKTLSFPWPLKHNFDKLIAHIEDSFSQMHVMHLGAYNKILLVWSE